MSMLQRSKYEPEELRPCMPGPPPDKNNQWNVDNHKRTDIIKIERHGWNFITICGRVTSLIWSYNMYNGIQLSNFPESKVHGANVELTWVLSVPDGPHVGPMNLAISVHTKEVVKLFLSVCRISVNYKLSRVFIWKKHLMVWLITN